MMNPTAFHFADPRWLWLALMGPVLLAWLHRYAARARHGQLARLAAPSLLPALTATHSPVRRQLKETFLVAAVALAGLALARPQWGGEAPATTRLGEDQVFVLDCSRSMLTGDVTPNRLQHAKFAILDYVRRQSHGRVGLVAFAGSAFIQCPLTFDSAAFEDTLLDVNDQTIPVPGTDLGRALNEAYLAMDPGSRRKIILLLTDGEDLEQSGVTAAKALATNGVVIYSLGVGTAAGKEISFVNAAGQPELVRDASGAVVRSRLDEPTLRQIAAATGGSYHPLGALGEGLNEVQKSIRNLDRAQARNAAPTGSDRFHLFVAGMLLLLIAESVIGTRKRPVPVPS